MKRLLPLVLPLLLAACATDPAWERNFGNSVRMARTSMTLNPANPARNEPVAGMDGAAGHLAMTRYLNTFKEPPPVVNVINIGGAIGAK